MARFPLALNAGVVLTPGQSVLKYQFTPVGVLEIAGEVGSISAQSTTVVTDLATVSTNGTTVVHQLGSIYSSLGTLISTIGSGTGSAQAQALLTLVNAGTTDAATLATNVATAVTDANTAQTEAVAAAAAVTADIVVSVNSANITTVTELRRAFDKLIDLAKGGVGGLTP